MSSLTKQFGEILGINARTLQYSHRSNPAATRLANNKLATKRALQKAAVPTPRLYARITSRQELQRFRWTKLPSSFVLKPNSSSGGGGIIVVFGRNKKGNWIRADKSEIFIPELRNHVLDILDGSFSAGNIPDTVLFEQRIKVHHDLKPYSAVGIPDVRVLVYNLVPVMAMLRLSTPESVGRANLHAGGIGVGINLVHGLTTTAIYRDRLIDTLPGQRRQLSGIRLPQWSDTLLLAVRAARASGLNFVGVDIAIDRDDGPLVLELNARPGLEIQFANMAPLKSRLARVSGLKVATPERGITIAKNLFGADTENEIEDISGRTILGIEEAIDIIDAENESHNTLAKIDTGAYRTTIDEALAKKLNIAQTVVDRQFVRGALGRAERPIINLKFRLRGRTVKSKAFVADRSRMNYDIIIGRRDLKGFLVDPSKAPSRKG